MRVRASVVLLVAALGCGKKPAGNGQGSGSSGSSTVPPPAEAAVAAPAEAGVSPPAAPPAAKLRAVLDKQVAALPDKSADLLATFGKDAVALTPEIVTVTPDYTDMGHDIAVMNPHSTFVSAKVTSFHAGGTDKAAWLAAELEIVTKSGEPGEKPSQDTRTIRTIELLDGAQDWKVVAASFAEVKPMERRDSAPKVEGATDGGPLAKLVVAPADLAAAFASDPNVAVFGTDPDEHAFGGDAKTLLGTWSKLALAVEPGAVREVRTAGYGYVAADINLTSGTGHPYRLTALLLAVPGANGAWTPVALHFAPL